MKSTATFALVALLCVPAKAQLGGMGGVGGPGAASRSIELELLEMEQEADKAVLKEALQLQARQGMKPVRGTDSEKRQSAEDTEVLREFIARKKAAVIERAAEVNRARVTGSMVGARGGRGDQRDKSDQQAKIDQQATYERWAEAQVNVQLLETQLALLQEPLNRAVQALAAAENAASNDDSNAASVEVARKEFEKIKSKYVAYNKQLQGERMGMRLMGGMDGGMGGMGGGMGGMGGGFR